MTDYSNVEFRVRTHPVMAAKNGICAVAVVPNEFRTGINIVMGKKNIITDKDGSKICKLVNPQVVCTIIEQNGSLFHTIRKEHGFAFYENPLIGVATELVPESMDGKRTYDIDSQNGSFRVCLHHVEEDCPEKSYSISAYLGFYYEKDDIYYECGRFYLSNTTFSKMCPVVPTGNTSEREEF